MKKALIYLSTIAVLLAIIVVGLGAYTRLTNAGLGCPDWPGCYGQLHLPQSETARAAAQALYPDQPIEATKAWTEMIHRYLAGTLGIFIISGFILSLWRRRNWRLPGFLCCWLIFQAALGMWTVTWRLLPVVVMGHLLSGAILFVGLCLWRSELASYRPPSLPVMRRWFMFGVIIILLQMALGGWVSANYAGVACIGFPMCNGSWFPLAGLKQGLYLFSPIGESYQGGLLQSHSRAAIQVLHRMGAMVTAAYLIWVIYLLRHKTTHLFWRRMSWVVLLLLACQWALGIINVVYFLPLPIAVMHNVVAVLLLSVVSLLCYWSGQAPSPNAEFEGINK